jgi:hypothetical protein
MTGSYEQPVVGDDMRSDPLEVFWIGVGQASALHSAPDGDPVDEVRKVAEEVTGRVIARPEKPRMGFL